MNEKKRNIEVIDKESKNLVKIIRRKPFFCGWMGNFTPLWVRYNKQEYLLKSYNGDVSDPFRGGDIGQFFIEV